MCAGLLYEAPAVKFTYFNSVKVYFDTSFFLIFKIFPVLTGCCDRVKNSRSSVLCGRVVQLELFSIL